MGANKAGELLMKTILIILFFSSLLFGQYFDDTDANIKLHLTFENSDITDLKSHPTTAVGSITFTDGFKTGTKSAYFNKSSYIYILNANAADLNFSTNQSFSIVCVISPETKTAQTFLSKRQTSTLGWSFNAHLSLRLEGQYADGTNNSNNRLSSLDDSLKINTYAVCGLVYHTETDSMLFYIDGSLRERFSMAAVTGNPANTANVHIGNYSTGYFGGWMDEIIVYNDVRTGAEMLSDYNLVSNYPPETDTGQDKGFNEYSKFKRFKGLK